MKPWYENTFNLLTIIIYLLYIAVFILGWNKAPEYLTRINHITQIFVGVLLIWFFNPFKKYKYDPFHKELSFTAGIFLISATILTRIIKRVQQVIKPIRDEVRDEIRDRLIS